MRKGQLTDGTQANSTDPFSKTPPSKTPPRCVCGDVARRWLLLLFNTTRAHTPDPQAGATITRTEVPGRRCGRHNPFTFTFIQPVHTQAVNRQNVGEEEAPS